MRVSAFSASVVLVASTIAACNGEPNAPVVPVATVTITPANPVIVLADCACLPATALDATGNALGGRAVQWSSSDDTKAAVSDAGVVSAKALGSVQITATIEQQVATTTISIVPVPPAVRVDNFFTAFSW